MRKLHFTGTAFLLLSLWIVLSSSSGGRATSANTGNTGAPSETTPVATAIAAVATAQCL